MPWEEMRRMDQRIRFAGALISGLYTMTELCTAYGISRKTGYKWARRYRREGVDGLKDRSRAPIRFDISDSDAEISIYLAPGKHGKGYGSELVESAENWLIENKKDINVIVAEVMAKNDASNRIFTKSGYVINMMRYRKSIRL